MKALITGASTGIGRDIARILCNMGAELILVARNAELLEELKAELGGKPKVISLDLSVPENCYQLYDMTKDEDIDILINNAGFGTYGESSTVPLETELNMIDLNIKAVHILTKLFLKDFEEKDKGHILNVASIAGFLSGPLMSTYYATKGYVVKFSTALFEELRRKKSNVHISVLCPGPVDTEFNNRAGVNFLINGHKSRFVAEYAIKKMFKNKLIIAPGLFIKLGIILQRFVPTRLLLKICYMLQSCKK
ncbi:MAG: SDR family NAD(P)-dependent oxidoreductase [Clostridia bacterium]|nr:SDR family NAD(P)-dependent oxidoreductase [Clostridia bacterium]